MFTFILLSKFDNYTIEKKKLIQFSYNHLLNNLEKYNLEAEILIVDMGSKLGYLCDNKIFLLSLENSITLKVRLSPSFAILSSFLCRCLLKFELILKTILH